MVLPWSTEGARLTLPQDLEHGYLLGRFGATTLYDCWPAAFPSERAARHGLPRLVTLGIARTFPRTDLTQPDWFSLTDRGLEWVVGESGCQPEELRRVTGLKRTNTVALAARNRFWASLVAASRARPDIELALVRPEWELRRQKTALDPVVPDILFVLSTKAETGERLLVWMGELDSGYERAVEWKAKAAGYTSVRGRIPLYGASDWRVLAVVPTVRRAITVARAVCESGAGAFVYLGVAESLEWGHALDSDLLWRAPDLLAGVSVQPIHSLLGGDPGQRPLATAAGGFDHASGGRS